MTPMLEERREKESFEISVAMSGINLGKNGEDLSPLL
jgi:hypothetical protein